MTPALLRTPLAIGVLLGATAAFGQTAPVPPAQPAAPFLPQPIPVVPAVEATPVPSAPVLSPVEAIAAPAPASAPVASPEAAAPVPEAAVQEKPDAGKQGTADSYLDAVREQRKALVEERRQAKERPRPAAGPGDAQRQAREAAVEQRREALERYHEARRNAMPPWATPFAGPWGAGPQQQWNEVREEQRKSMEEQAAERRKEVEEHREAMQRLREERMQWGPAGYPLPYGPMPYGSW